MELALPRLEIRIIRPESRSDTSASPDLRKAIPHGTLRFLATVPAILGLGGFVVEDDWDGLALVWVAVGDGVGTVLERGESSMGLDEPLAPPPLSEHPVTDPTTKPADPSSSVRLVITP